MHFHGDLMITDPGYVAKNAEDWKRCGYGDHMERLGFSTVLSALDLCYGFRRCHGIFAGGDFTV